MCVYVDLQQHIILHSCATQKKKKNAEHTRMHTIFRNSSSQYSRRLLSILAQTNRRRGKPNNVDCPFVYTTLIPRCIYYSSTCTIVQTKKKIRSTHACTPSFRNFLRQYSRQLLSILAQPPKKNHSGTTVVCQRYCHILLFLRGHLVFK